MGKHIKVIPLGRWEDTKWTVRKELESRKTKPTKSGKVNTKRYVLCRCNCGVEKEIEFGALRGGKTTCCPDCANKARRGKGYGGRPQIDVQPGDVWGHWMVLAEIEQRGAVRYVEVRCLGCRETIKEVEFASIRHSVGTKCKEVCDRAAKTIHGASGVAINRGRRTRRQMTDDEVKYEQWKSMKSRASRKTGSYANVNVCPEWLKFEDFLANPPRGDWFRGCALCRDGDTGDYEPSNCRWDTKRNNGREAHTRYFLLDGTPMKDAAEANGVSYMTAAYRVRESGMTPDEAIQPRIPMSHVVDDDAEA